MKVAVGLSGGVDSSLSAHLLKEAGHDVTGVYLECWKAPGCRAEEDRKDALAVALELEIPFRTLDFKDAYRQRVVEIFFEDYKKGLTPNPDVWCNTEIKFGLFYDWAMAQGFDAIATGHYARVGKGIEGQPTLHMLRSADEKKDQTYFLYRTEQEQLSHILFPIGHLTKKQVREEAKRRNIVVAGKPDSQGICFIGDINVHDFLKERFGELPGDVLDMEGNVVGKHKGHWFYTVGQRHGFELFPVVYTKHEDWKHVLPPLYVISKNAENNTIIVGFGQETVADNVPVRDVFVRDEAVLKLAEGESVPLMVRVRHGGALLNASFVWKDLENKRGEIRLEEAQRGLAPGQSIVWYSAEDSQICLGGCVISERVFTL